MNLLRVLLALMAPPYEGNGDKGAAGEAAGAEGDGNGDKGAAGGAAGAEGDGDEGAAGGAACVEGDGDGDEVAAGGAAGAVGNGGGAGTEEGRKRAVEAINSIMFSDVNRTWIHDGNKCATVYEGEGCMYCTEEYVCDKCYDACTYKNDNPLSTCHGSDEYGEPILQLCEGCRKREYWISEEREEFIEGISPPEGNKGNNSFNNGDLVFCLGSQNERDGTVGIVLDTKMCTDTKLDVEVQILKIRLNWHSVICFKSHNWYPVPINAVFTHD